jgi:cytochrome c oxidase cbb3-type subunit 2
MSLVNQHKKLERNSFWFLLFMVVAVLIGGIAEIVPLFMQRTAINAVEGMRPYTPLELAGYDIYIREGCYNCHSQQIRPLRDEVARYGHYSIPAESMYDHPFQWGSKRTGPDLARVGGKYSNEWHAAHLKNPRDVVPESIMPTYHFLSENGASLTDIAKHLGALSIVGVPYTPAMIENAYKDAVTQADPNADATGLQERYGAAVKAQDYDGDPVHITEMDALIAYLQSLGTMVKFTAAEPMATAETAGE